MSTPAIRSKRMSSSPPSSDSEPDETEIMNANILEGATILAPKVLRSILRHTLLPILDVALSEEQKEEVSSAFSRALVTHHREKNSRNLDYARRFNGINASMKYLQDRDDNPGRFWFQSPKEMMENICGEMVLWCQALILAIEDGDLDLAGAHKALLFMRGVEQKLCDTNYRLFKFDESSWDAEYLLRVNDKARYHDVTIHNMLLKLWRDILLISIDTGGRLNDKLVKRIVRDLSKGPKPDGRHNKKTFKYWIRPDKVKPDEDNEEWLDRLYSETNVEGGTWDDDWHSEGMRDALPKLRDLLSHVDSGKA